MQLLDFVNQDRLAADTLELINIASPTGNSNRLADRFKTMLTEVGCVVERHEFIPNNPTLVAVYDGGLPGKTVLFNGHMDTIPLQHEPAAIRDGRVYGRGSCDMKGSLAAIVEALRALRGSGLAFPGKLMIVANSLHESPGGRGEDLLALLGASRIEADAAVVMEGAVRDCTVAQLGSATFEILIEREGEPSHQLYTPEGTAHPISIAAEVIRKLDELNEELATQYIQDIGHASYFVGSVHSGKFYNQHPKQAEIVGVRRYSPESTFEEVEKELQEVLQTIAKNRGVEISLDLVKVRDGYRVDPSDPAVAALVAAVRDVRGIPLPMVGKKLVTDAGIFAKKLGIPVLCHGPDQSSAHGDTEYVEIDELVLATKVYLRFMQLYMGFEN